MLALLHQEPSKRGPQTTEGVVARVMRRMLDQVRHSIFLRVQCFRDLCSCGHVALCECLTRSARGSVFMPLVR